MLMIDEDQAINGVVGGVLRESDCRILLHTDVLAYKTEAEQTTLCTNSCYDTVADNYSRLLDLDCYNGVDDMEEASSRTHAASFLLACQRTKDDEYCSMY